MWVMVRVTITSTKSNSTFSRKKKYISVTILVVHEGEYMGVEIHKFSIFFKTHKPMNT